PMNLRDAILSAPDIQTSLEPVDVPEWGVTVYVGVMSGTDRDRFESVQVSDRKFDDVRARLVAACLRDAEGRPVFTAADVPALGAKSGRVLDRLFSAAMRVNAIGPREIEELAGN
ncbi:MAG: hypothetical protein INR70_08775, partial [Parafilimonas terrae]|nr:hypothetical protein [Parafilimonas terrae]